MYEEGHLLKEREDGTQTNDPTHEAKLRNFITKIASDMCVYGKVDTAAVTQTSQLIKFNRKLSIEYAQKMASPIFRDNIETALYILLKDLKDITYIKSNEFLDHVQKLMSIKVTKQEVYFKKTIREIHDGIITALKLEKWYNNLSVQSQAISRNFVAYYLAFYIRSYI